MTRYLPDNDLLALQVIRAALPGDTCGTGIPSDLIDHLPFHTVRVLADKPAHPKFGARIRVIVQTWSDSRKAASDHAESVRIVFNDAWLNGTQYAAGHVSFQECLSAPSELPTASLDGIPAQNLYRFQATYRLVVRSN